MTIGPEIMSPGLAALESPLSIKRNLPPGKESYERVRQIDIHHHFKLMYVHDGSLRT